MRVGLVYSLYGHPAQPYLQTAAERVGGEGVEVKIYSRMSPRLKDVSVHVLQGPEGWRGGVLGCLEAVRQPTKAVGVIWGIEGRGLRQRFRDWIDLRELICDRCNVLHLQNAGLYKALSPYLMRAKIPFIVSFRGHDTVVRPEIDPDWKRILREIYEKAAVLHFVSGYLAAQGRARGAPEGKCRVIRPAVDVSYFVPNHKRQTSRLNVVSVGRLVWEKALHLGLLVIKKLADSGVDVEYDVVGDGPAKPELMRWARELGIEGRVYWRGMLDQAKLRDMLAKADVYLHPAVSEAFGVAILEAMAMELPVVATRVGGIGEAVADGVTGILCEFGDVEGMAEAVRVLWREPGLREAMGREGRKRIEAEFTIEREVREWRDLYIRLAQKGRVEGC